MKEELWEKAIIRTIDHLLLDLLMDKIRAMKARRKEGRDKNVYPSSPHHTDKPRVCRDTI